MMSHTSNSEEARREGAQVLDEVAASSYSKISNESASENFGAAFFLEGGSLPSVNELQQSLSWMPSHRKSEELYLHP